MSDSLGIGWEAGKGEGGQYDYSQPGEHFGPKLCGFLSFFQLVATHAHLIPKVAKTIYKTMLQRKNYKK